ncbi:MAG TPA: serine protease, partial [Pirellulales bacterium]|nr:serine protease [Pirellulales bacterium]
MVHSPHCRSNRRKLFAEAATFRASLKRATAMLLAALLCVTTWSMAPPAFAQAVGLPAPRLLTTMPMGGKAGAQVEITISGESLEDVDELVFSDPRITAAPKLDDAGQPEASKYVVSIAADCPAGLYEARMMTRLGISSSRAFSVGSLDEVVRTKPNTSLDTAMELPLNSVCNASTSSRAVDHYTFAGRKGQRVMIECAARGIDSKLQAVLIVGDAQGRDLQVERQGGVLEFAVPADGKYVIKVHDLTYNGGPTHFYRLTLRDLPAEAPIPLHPSTHTVSSFSWPPPGLPEAASTAESEPNNDRAHVQKISLPCDIAGGFFPAADVDVFEFEAKKGDVWWVEVASERFGLPTDPAIVV